MTDQKEAPAGEGGGNKSSGKSSSSANDKANGASNQARRSMEFYEPEPWLEPIDGAGLLDEIVTMYSRHISLPEGAPEAMALWVLFTHGFDAAEVSPRLVFTSPVPECGKTIALGILGRLVPRTLFASNITPAVIFRVIERDMPTLLIDEADTFMDSRDELTGILNSGHTRNAAYVWRCEGNDHEPRGFSTWAPIAVAMIGNLPPALRSRSIMVRMQRARPEEGIERLRAEHENGLHDLGRKAARWAQDHLDALRHADPPMPEGLSGRAADNWRPLLAIADVAGGHWPETARRVALSLSGETEPPRGVQLLSAIRSVFMANGVDRFSSADLCQQLDAADDQWLWSPNTLAHALKPFGIRPHGVRIGYKTPKGYYLSNFEDAFARYLSSEGTGSPNLP